jgi:hypothetical protein
MSGKQRAVYCAAERSSCLTEERILQMQPWDVKADFFVNDIKLTERCKSDNSQLVGNDFTSCNQNEPNLINWQRL